MAARGRNGGADAGARTVVVLGAGINGAALARELALSGVGVVVADTGDLAGGATAWSTRLIHGGLRYLEYGEIGLVRESLQERNRLVRLAPHLVRPLEFYLPLAGRGGGLVAAAARLVGCESWARSRKGGGGRGSRAVGIGLTLYDLLAAGAGWPRHRMVRAGAAGMPPVDPGGFPLGAVYSDAQLLFPERFTAELLVDGRAVAATTGARFDVCTHRSLRLDASGHLEIGPSPRGGDALALRPDAIVNATGAWVDRTLDAIFPGLPHGGGPALIGGTKGSHLVLRCPPLREALAHHGIYAEAADGRPVFVLPFGPALALVGTTDIPFHGDPATARADEDEIGYLLAAVGRLFPQVAVRRDDVQQHYCGVRPLPAVGGSSPAGITRRHLLVRHRGTPLPAWSIVGGKLTTCRSLAERSAAEVLRTLALPVLGTSRERPLPGHFHVATRADLVRRTEAAAGRSRFDDPRAVAGPLVDLFGSRAVDVWDGVETPAPDRPACLRGVGLPAAAVAFCVRDEWAVTLEDVVERRLMLSFHERLSRGTLADVAAALVRCGALDPDGAMGAVEACVAGLAARYGRVLPDAVPA
jgi:glycerol-3-phosphate dehydrogenase